VNIDSEIASLDLVHTLVKYTDIALYEVIGHTISRKTYVVFLNVRNDILCGQSKTNIDVATSIVSSGVVDVVVEDTANYTCIVSGPHNVILASVTHLIQVRGLTVFACLTIILILYSVVKTSTNVPLIRNCSAYCEPMTSHALGELADSRRKLQLIAAASAGLATESMTSCQKSDSVSRCVFA